MMEHWDTTKEGRMCKKKEVIFFIFMSWEYHMLNATHWVQSLTMYCTHTRDTPLLNKRPSRAAVGWHLTSWLFMVRKWLQNEFHFICVKSSAFFWRRHMAPASRCPFVRANTILRTWREKPCSISHPQRKGMQRRCGSNPAVKDPFWQRPGALCNLTSSSPPLCHPPSPADVAPVHSVISPLTQDKENWRASITH